MANNSLAPSIMWYTDEAGKLEYIPFIGTLEETHKGQATISKYPVQNGYEISNHMIRHNRQLTLKVVAPDAILGGIDLEGADTGHLIGSIAEKLGIPAAHISTVIGGVVADPLGVAGNYLDGLISSVEPVVSGIANVVDDATSWAGSKLGFTGTDISKYTDGYAPSSSRRIDLFNKIKLIQDRGLICNVSTLLGQYSNLVLIGYESPTTIDTAHMAMFTLVFEEVRILDSLGESVIHLNPNLPSGKELDSVLIKANQIHSTGKVNFIKDRAKLGADKVGGFFA